MSDFKKSLSGDSDGFNQTDDNGWSDAERESWVTMAMAAATKSLRTLSIEDIEAKNDDYRNDN